MYLEGGCSRCKSVCWHVATWSLVEVVIVVDDVGGMTAANKMSSICL